MRTVPALVAGLISCTVAVGWVAVPGASAAGANTVDIRVVCSPSPVAAGASTSCTAYLDGIAGGPAPSGDISWQASNGFPLGCTLVPVSERPEESACTSGVKTEVKATTTLNTRTETVEADYAGDDTYAPVIGYGTFHVLPKVAPYTQTCWAGSGIPGGESVGSAPVTCHIILSSHGGGLKSPTGHLTGKVGLGPDGKVVGHLKSTSCTLVVSESQSQCSLTYIPTVVPQGDRLDSIEITYSGDANYQATTFLWPIKIHNRLIPPHASICLSSGSSYPQVVAVGRPITCSYYVGGESPYPYAPVGAPTGKVTFGFPAGTTATGRFTAVTCSPLSSTTIRCTTTYTPTGTATQSRVDSIRVSIAADTSWQAVTDVFPISVIAPEAAGLSVSCDSPAHAGQSGACYVQLTSATHIPSGSITLKGSQGKMDTPTCTVSPFYAEGLWIAICSANYTPAGTGSAQRLDTITAAYSGDAIFKPASAAQKLHVAGPAPT